MKFSKNWLQEYIKEELPEDKIIEEELNAKAFEVEGVEVINGGDEVAAKDSIFDIKVLPNRAHDALGHVGMAREICASLSLTFNNDFQKEIENIKSLCLEKNDGKNENKLSEILSNKNINFSNEKILVEVMDKKSCTRFATIKIDNVIVGESPEFIKNALQSIGQKSINNIVDITNYVQFMLNKPMHAYDANNIVGGIVVRYAEEGEKLITLDDKELELNMSTLVIADHEKSLGLAGIKGGKYSGVNKDTTSIIIESANFDSVLIRKTSQKYNLKTDASKRFENGIADALVIDALYETVRLILKYATSDNKEVIVSEITDVRCDNYTDLNYIVGVTKDEINSILGSNYGEVEIESSLNKLGFAFEKINTLDFIKENVEKVLGAEYKNPSSQRVDAPKYFSCSSLVSYLFKGIWMPSLSIDKYVFCKKIENINFEENKLDTSKLKYGDLIFANTNEGKIRYVSVEYMSGTKVPLGIDHVGIYIGDGKEDNSVLHATKVEGKVLIQGIEDFSKNRKIVGAGRVEENLSSERYIITIPHARLDLRIKEDIIEEIGRIIGYKTLIPTLPKLEVKKNYLNKKASYQNVIRNILFENNFSEVMNYSFVEKGDIALVKSAVNKNKLRTNIANGMLVAVNQNLSNLPVLNIETVKAFEFGNVFNKDIESNNLCISIDDGKKKSNYADSVSMIINEIRNKLQENKSIKSEESEINFEVKSTKPYIIEVNFDKVLEDLSDEYADTFIDEKYINKNIKFEFYSIMPFVVRDVAFWIDAENALLNTNVEKNENNSNGVKQDNILETIKSVAGDLCIRVTKFDEFKKVVDGVEKISLGYRLLYQSNTKTLTDEEVNMQSDNVYAKLRELGLEVR